MYLNNGRCINSFQLERYLLWVDNLDEGAVRKLLYPDDPQDVPRAIALMSAVIKLSRIDPKKHAQERNEEPPNVNVIADFDALRILGHILDNVLQPYINVNLSLSEQVTHLSRAAHILYASYHEQRRRLMPNQLYYDCQSMIKTAIFNIAKQQKLDPSAKFSLLDLGDDALELEFAYLRMSGGHHSAVNYRQALDRLGAARDIGGVLCRQPDLAHGHRRLNLTRSESVDHISRAHWVGDTVVSNCNLPSSWRQGKEDTLKILETTQL
ncbi:hypothetical protein PAXINDRAFT_89194, partial [Paxillus involutus ATCC 200175]